MMENFKNFTYCCFNVRIYLGHALVILNVGRSAVSNQYFKILQFAVFIEVIFLKISFKNADHKPHVDVTTSCHRKMH